MNVPTRDELTLRLKDARISKRLVRDLRHVPEEIDDASERDFLIITNKSKSEGVLLYEEKTIPFSLTKRVANARGRVEAIICDICATWQRGTNSAVLSIKRSPKLTSSFLVCADLDCSLHVRTLTDASKVSRTQLKEHLDNDARIARLQVRLHGILEE